MIGSIVEQIIIPVPEISSNSITNIFNRYLDVIVHVNQRLAKEVTCQLAKERIVLTIGGDHSIGLGSVAGSLQYDNNIGLIWFDAHGDMNTEATSPTGHIHGMPVASLMGLGSSKLNDSTPIHIKPENIFWIGSRDLDEGEQNLVKNLNLNVYSTELIKKVGMNHVMDKIKWKMEEQGIRNVHLSFDVDALDPRIFPATGVPVTNGLTIEDFYTFTNHLSSLPEIIALDFVEYYPTLDNENKDCKNLATHIITNIITSL